MTRLLADENFHGDILRGLLRVEEPKLDVLRVQDTEIYQASDPAVLDWAAKEGRILLTHDVQTMTKHAYDRIREGLPMPGVIEVRDDLPDHVYSAATNGLAIPARTNLHSSDSAMRIASSRSSSVSRR